MPELSVKFLCRNIFIISYPQRTPVLSVILDMWQEYTMGSVPNVDNASLLLKVFFRQSF